nr:MAG TPA: tail fiber protein [Caudoviricetes sp.]
MNRSDSPAKQPVPFGHNGQREPILATTPSGDNTASYDLGFPPITMTLKSAGGLPPKGQDMNQILYELSALSRWSSTNAINRYDATFSTSIGGYPQDALVLGDDGITVWRSSSNNNTNNPNSVTTGWVKVADDISSILQLGTASKRDVGVGANQIPDISYFTKSTAGGAAVIFTLPGGMIIQCGNIGPLSAGASVTVTYPIPFPLAMGFVIPAASASVDSTTPVALAFDSASVADSRNTVIFRNCSTRGNPGTRYLAIGY